MTQEDKQLLLKDLCARLPYKVFIHYHWSREGATIDEDRELEVSDIEELEYNIENPQDDWCENSWKPYLRPMSSMTEEEKDEYRIECNRVLSMPFKINGPYPIVDWLNAHYFDHRGLIPMGLALEATEGMYETE